MKTPTNGAVKAAEVIIDTIKDADNEATESPWWIIIDPKQMFSLDIHIVASMITGPFFSREDAEGHLKARRYGFGKHAKVYCHSGYWSDKYKTLCRAINSHTSPTVKADRLDLSKYEVDTYNGPSKVDKFTERCVLKGQRSELVVALRSAYAELDAQELEIGELVGGLEFYADEDNWADDWEINGTYNGIIPTDCDRKGGKRARQDLAKHKEQSDG